MPQRSDSDDEFEQLRGTLSPDENGLQYSSSPEGDALENGHVQEGMLPRDMPKKTAFFDPVADRQMTQTDAKLFYQRSQLDLQKIGANAKAGKTEITPHASPVISAKSAQDKELYSRLPSGAESSSPTWSPPRARPGSVGSQLASSVELGEMNGNEAQLSTAAHRKHTGLGKIGNLGGVTADGLVDPAAQAQMLKIAVPEGIGSSTYMDADPQITSELSLIFKNVQKVIDLRRKYMSISLQNPKDNPKDEPRWSIYPPPPEPAWSEEHEKAMRSAHGHGSVGNSLANSMVLPAECSNADGDYQPRKTYHAQAPKKRKPGQDIGEDFIMGHLLPLPEASDMTFRLDKSGVYQVYRDEKSESPAIAVPTLRNFYVDLETIISVSADGPSKSFAYRRLQYLEGKFNLYALLNEYQETADSKKVPHRDFYNVRKVDTHVHHSACMNQKHLLRFIKSKMKKCPDEKVLVRDGKELTLQEVFDSINLKAYDLSIDTLDMHVSQQPLLHRLLEC
jgi:AMP deaminase